VALRAPKRRIRDFSGLEHRIVELAIEEFQVYVCTKYAFPEDLEDLDEWVNNCWNNACERQESSLKLSTTHAKLVCALSHYYSFVFVYRLSDSQTYLNNSWPS
jgi:hypothetical protein